jgi:Peptidase family M1 domain
MYSKAFFVSVLFFTVGLSAQTVVKPIEPNGAARTPNGEKMYQALRTDFPGTDGVAVKDLTLEREGGVFHFDQGNFYFYTPVEGKVTGAVFLGKGRFDLQPKAASEKRSLAMLTKTGTMTQELTSVVLRFTDGTADEIRKASTGAASPDSHALGDAENLEKGFRGVLHENLDLRLLEDVAGGAQGGFFLASFRMGSAIGGRNVLFIVDPEGTFHTSPDQVELTTWSDVELQPWVATSMHHADPKQIGAQLQVTDERLDVTFAASGAMKVTAETTAKMRRDGVRVVRLNLYRTLRVSGVYAEDGAPLDFVQEAKEYDPDFAVILPKAAKAGDSVRLRIEYAGKDVVRNDGNGTYYLMGGARDCWYPSGQSQMGDFANFHMTFHVPKQLQIVATGAATPRQPEDGGMVKSIWETNSPIPVAGFNLGDFKTDGTKTPAGFGVDAFADVGLPTQYERLAESDTLGGLSSAQALKGEISQGSAAIQIYSDYFGKLPYDHVALTEQSACTYGQSWPMLVYLPICGFWDATVLKQVGLLDDDPTYWKQVTAHEVSHQWWGSLVGFSSYRDQWMSEGFATYSVSLFLKGTSPKTDDYHAFWKEQQRRLIEKNTEGVRPIDAGPLTMGGRVSNSKSGEDVYQMLIYSKGAYVLHMIEEQFWNVADQDEPFKKAMQQFVKDYSGKAATTEDWKKSMEKSMPKSMDLRGDGKLDWFFDQFVYGTDLPHYVTSSDFSVGADGLTTAHFKITQSNVPNTFVMRVPVYLQLEDGQTKRLFNAVMHGDATIDQTVKLPNRLPKNAKAILVNYNADILTDN